MSVLIQFRRDTAANWVTNNPTLAIGELGLETDTGAYKIGNGTNNWNTLVYYQLSPNLTTSIYAGQSSDPSAPSAGSLTLYSKSIGGRMMMKAQIPGSEDTPLQPFLGRNKMGLWLAPGNATTVPGVFGYTAPTAVGTATARTIATTNLFTRMRRLGYVSSATAGNLCGARVAVAQVTVGDGTLGGFHKVIRFGISDAVLVSGARTFVGMSVSTSAATNVEPNTLTNVIGVGHGAADTNLKIFYGGSAAQTPIDLGANFPTGTVNTDVYELALYSPAASSTIVYYEVTRLNTGHVAAGNVTGTAGTAIPANSSLMTYCNAWRCNNATAAAAGLDIMSDYIEVLDG